MTCQTLPLPKRLFADDTAVYHVYLMLRARMMAEFFKMTLTACLCEYVVVQMGHGVQPLQEPGGEGDNIQETY